MDKGIVGRSLDSSDGRLAPLLAAGVAGSASSGFPPLSKDEEESDPWEFALLMLQQEEREWLHALVRWAVSQLGAREREVIKRLFWDGWTEAEIAHALGISQQMVSKIRKRALQRLNQRLAGARGADRAPIYALIGGLHESRKDLAAAEADFRELLQRTGNPEIRREAIAELREIGAL